MATGTVTITEQVHTSMKKVKFAWTATTGGSAGDTTTNLYSGLLYRTIIVPGSSNSAPSSNYDVVVNDADGYDVLNGAGANSSTASNDYFGGSTGGDSQSPISAVSSKLTLAVTNAGDAKSGTVVLYIR